VVAGRAAIVPKATHHHEELKVVGVSPFFSRSDSVVTPLPAVVSIR
jgi:hypothetical protein